MKVLVIGSGGRENAIVHKLSESKNISKIFAIPGNGGIYEYAECVVEFNPEKDFQKIANFVKENRIDITIVGPEDPLAGGIVDIFQKNNLKIFGPTKRAALIEASKSFAKKVMRNKNVPTGFAEVFDNFSDALNYLKKTSYPVAIKADGLAKGKGVFITHTFQQAKEVLNQIMEKKIFGEAGKKVLIEEYLEGEEMTVLAFVDGKNIKIMPPAKDYKRLLDGNRGPNTGGMGAFAPVVVPKKDLEFIENKILYPTIEGLNQLGIKYKGVLYAGLIKTSTGYKVLEFNCRFGDPETQVILPLLKTDLIEIVQAVIEENLDKIKIKWKNKSCVTVVLASKGYPEKYEKLLKIRGLKDIRKNVIVFHAGTVIQNNVLLTNGGRVLNVTALASSKKKARKIVYENIKFINFKNMVYRKDIAL